jgi:hypothetical protein
MKGAVASALALAALSGCAGGGAEMEGVATVELALTNAPSDGLCLRLTTTQVASGLKVVKTSGLTANMMNHPVVVGLPVGDVTLFGEVFGVTCPNVTAATALTWVSDLQSATLLPDLTSSITLTLHKASKVNVGVDFVTDMAVEEVDFPVTVSQMVGAPDGSIIASQRSRGSQLLRAKGAFDIANIVDVSGQSRYIAVANDGTIFAANGGTGLQSFTAAGALKASATLPFNAGDLALDPATNTLWVASVNTPQVLRIPNATTSLTLPAPILMPGSATSAPGIALAADGSPRVGNFVSATGQVVQLTAAGAIVGSTATPLPVRDVAVAADGTVYWASLVAGNNLGRIPPGGVSQVIFNDVAATTWALLTTPKGVLFALPSGGLYLATTAGAFQRVILPESATVFNSLALAKSGQIWASDANAARALVFTLP